MFKEKLTLEESYGEYSSAFDWWQATVDPAGMGFWDKKKGEEVPDIHVLLLLIGEKFPAASWTRHGGSNGYAYRDCLKRGETTLCNVQHGGTHDLPNVSASGSTSAVVRSVVTGAIPEGKASRIDSAFDSLSGTAEFRRVTAWAEARARKAGISYRWITNSDPNEGDTLYIGKRGSRVMIRIYEKGKETGYKAGEWWRAEVELHPDSKAKMDAYSYSAGMVWSVNRMTRELWQFLGGAKLSAPGFQYQARDKDLHDKLLHMGIQYGNLLAQALAVYGTPSAMVEVIDRLLLEVEKQPITGRVQAPAQCPF